MAPKASTSKAVAIAEPEASETSKIASFASLSSSIDGRLLRSLAAQGFTHPTPIQAAVLPLALKEGKDILARARTGSGKTLAYGIPLVQRVLAARAKVTESTSSSPDHLATRALILVPTRELAEQVSTHIRDLCKHLADSDAVRVLSLAGDSSGGKGKGKASSHKSQVLALAEKPDVVVATPSRALKYLQAEQLNLEHLECLVIDEADLILSYGHSSDDIRAILAGGANWSLPAVYQSFLMSATLTGEVDELKGIVLRNPVTVKLSDADSSSAASALTQYVIRTTEDDKFLLLYVLLKLRLIKGKVLIFVNDTDRGYRVKLFLEKFGIRAGVLNAELPFNSRYHAVQEFNRGVFPFLIATDESGLEGLELDSEDEAEPDEPAELMDTQPLADDDDAELNDDENEESAALSKKRKSAATSSATTRSRKQRKNAKSSNDYGVTRGIDFVDVACVLNFDLPTSARSYVHRVGRTARAGRSGMSLSFVIPKAMWGTKHQHGLDTSLKSAKRDEKIWKRIERSQRAAGVPNDSLKEYRFDMQQVEGFRYRMEDGLRSVTRASVREARIKELKIEVLNSDKLKAHFEDNPRDLAFLKHDKPLHPSRVQPHMKHVPSYLMPRIAPVGGSSAATDGDAPAQSLMQPLNGAGSGSKYVPFHKNGPKGGKRRDGKNARTRSSASARGKSSSRKDPLKSFKRK